MPDLFTLGDSMMITRKQLNLKIKASYVLYIYINFLQRNYYLYRYFILILWIVVEAAVYR